MGIEKAYRNAKIIDRYEQSGIGVRGLASEFNISRSRVCNILTRAGVERRPVARKGFVSLTCKWGHGREHSVVNIVKGKPVRHCLACKRVRNQYQLFKSTLKEQGLVNQIIPWDQFAREHIGSPVKRTFK